MEKVQVTTRIDHAPPMRQSVVTIRLHGGDLAQREAMARVLVAQALATETVPSKKTAPTLSSVFAVLARPTPKAEPQKLDYDAPFVLAPLS